MNNDFPLIQTRQGFPLPLLLIQYIMEVLAMEISQKQQIGISKLGIKVKLSLFTIDKISVENTKYSKNKR